MKKTSNGLHTIDILMICVLFWFCTKAILAEHRVTRNFIIQECSIEQGVEDERV